ncbi:YgaP-like transmembrane domain [Zestomonas carbonaria]|uniref:DUF2892 domain-containing protein n=1 Tax=Zestomonas carbonaria TaxID=2762745 RepID=A0A7U7EMG6_9GAMM|nr:YgaP-like transmembrane domain [Pseudomonas carbonaria]CAD5107729.1 hypothetical protein PSEWESI4_02004 [Pseudomonas carbonaria]
MTDTATPTHQSPNVHGWERAACLGGGALLIGKGLRRGGLLGLLELAVGGIGLARGITGQCPAKRYLAETRAELDEIRRELDVAGKRLAELGEARKA